MTSIKNLDAQLHHTDIKTAYFAGIIDGEGHVGHRIEKVWPSGHVTMRSDIIVAMTCEETVFALGRYFGRGSISVFDPPPPRKRNWRWAVSALNARYVASLIRPFSITKKSQLDAILNSPIIPLGSGAHKFGEDSPRAQVSRAFVDLIRQEHETELANRLAAGFTMISRGWFQQAANRHKMTIGALHELVYRGWGKGR